MKITGKVFLASLLVVGLLTLSFGSAFAMPSSSHELADPVATASKSGENFKQLVVDTFNLPGTVNADNLILPVGFATGQEQISGNGLQVSGLQPGEKVNLTFDFYFYNYKWAGSIYKWSGTAWVKLETMVIQEGADGVTSWATADGVGNGIYALIIGNYGLPPVDVPDQSPTVEPTKDIT